jgi:hypothetical protein
MTRDDILWFKTQFAARIAPALAGTPLTVDFLTAIACQETGHIWARLQRQGLATADILAVCVGDTIDAPGRRAFPISKARLVEAPDGDRMFEIARAALERMAPLVPGFDGAVAKPAKFCHGFGIFQYDLQHFLEDPAYFLDERFLAFEPSLDKALEELRRALAKNGLAGRTSLTDLELCGVAITYNKGSFDPQKGLKQGFQQDGVFYGEHIFDFLRMAKTVALPGDPAPLPEPPPGEAPLPPPTPIDAAGEVFEVDVRDTPLRLRSAPVTNDANVIARLPDGQRVQAVSGQGIKAFFEIETSLNGALLRGFAAREFLVPVAAGAVVPVLGPEPAPPAGGVIAVWAPRQPGSLTRRVNNAGAQSLNEPNQPSRTGTTPEALRQEIDAIIDYLDCEKASHKRYAKRDGFTFCNIYAHDFCHLAKPYLPRVWWTSQAIEKLTLGQTVEPKLGSTIEEQRANDLFRWLRDFGLRFGWRQTGTLTKLQTEVNQGAIGLIVARRVADGKPGHITIVVPETGDLKAKRNAAGEVTAPLQSQAGGVNFRRSTAPPNWWLGAAFAESAFWLHG